MKSTTLTTAAQTHIAQFVIDNPGWVDIDYAQHLGCTVAQLRYARDKARKGQLKVRRRGLSEKEQTRLLLQESESHELLARQCHTALAQLEADGDMVVEKRMGLLSSIARTQRTIQTIRLQAHMQTADADVIYRIIRRFLPDAGEEEIIKIYFEERDRCNTAD